MASMPNFAGIRIFQPFLRFAMLQSVLVVDDHPQIAELLNIYLGDRFTISSAANVDQLYARLKNGKIDVAVLDLELKGGHNGLDFIGDLHKAGCQVLVYSGTLDPECIRNCFLQKVAGVMDKNESIKDLAKAVGDVAAGHRVIPDKVLTALMRSKDDLMPRLTRKETVVLNYHFEVPMPSKTAIAAAMGLSVGRISNISTSIYGKLHVKDRHEMVEEAKRRGHRTSLPLPKKDPRERGE
jgi:DNA-binding NarL/FixJ family response regulator